MTTRIDWAQILDDMAFLLGEEDHTQPGGRMRCSTYALAHSLGKARMTLVGWLEGSEPKYNDGDMLLQRWAILTGKAREFAPRERVVFSAARMKEKA